jgi:periplasmic protein CpxP/Spy
MKKVFYAFLLFGTVGLFAQEKMDPKSLTKEQRVEKHVAKLKKELTLTDDQTVKVKSLITENVKKNEEKMAQVKAMKTDSKKLSEEEKALLKNQMSEKSMATEAQMKAILTPEQFTKWQGMRSEHKEKIIERRQKKQAEKATK